MTTPKEPQPNQTNAAARVTVDVIARRVTALAGLSVAVTRLDDGWDFVWPAHGTGTQVIVTHDGPLVRVVMRDGRGERLGEATFDWHLPDAIAGFVVESLR